ncbi:MAG: helix-turn-helix transcriptional regulator [Lentisphaeria bacterium]|nr:helix-turn-helix transcriptional regulator [Lentisphaeria bacterium]
MIENRTIREPLPPYCGESIKGLVERIRSAPEGDFVIDVEASRCHITTAHFRRLFKRQMGVPPRQFIIYCRLEKAAAMLLRGHSSVAEVALHSGFTDQNYFARMFKQQYRITQLEYCRTFR